MNWRNALLSGVLAAGLTMTFVPRAAADPPPWAGRWHHDKHWKGDHDRDDHWRHGRDRDHDYDRWEHRNRDWRSGRDDDYWRGRRWQRYDNDRWYGNRSYGRYGAPYYGGYRYDRRSDSGYNKLTDRMRNDQAKIAEIEPTGRHRKALQWYKDDLRNAQRDMDNYGNASR